LLKSGSDNSYKGLLWNVQSNPKKWFNQEKFQKRHLSNFSVEKRKRNFEINEVADASEYFSTNISNCMVVERKCNVYEPEGTQHL
jgi:hypothetical protein